MKIVYIKVKLKRVIFIEQQNHSQLLPIKYFYEQIDVKKEEFVLIKKHTIRMDNFYKYEKENLKTKM